MKNQQKLFTRALSIAVASGILAFQFLPMGTASAAQITARSLTLQTGTTPSDVNTDGLNDGGSMPGGTANHNYQFSLPSTTLVDTIVFEYCTTAAPVEGGIQCDAPTGLDASAAALGLDGDTGWLITNQTTNTVTFSGTEANLLGAKNFRIDNVINPTTTNSTFFARIATYDSASNVIDSGTVTASTATAIELEGVMPESLVFCAGETVGLTLGVPDCGTATAGDVAFDQLFSPTDTATANSQMAASTNAGAGYAITVNGPTLTSGSNTITPMVNTAGDPPIALQTNTSQFGMNLVANTTTTDVNDDPLGLDTNPIANTTNLKGQPAVDYDVADNFKFFGSDIVANSYNGGAGGSDSQIFTVSYVVNVPGSQPAGTYTTTLTYICTPTF